MRPKKSDYLNFLSFPMKVSTLLVVSQYADIHNFFFLNFLMPIVEIGCEYRLHKMVSYSRSSHSLSIVIFGNDTLAVSIVFGFGAVSDS